jgi:curli biogenesis system outer membrane secretion channel CsgG
MVHRITFYLFLIGCLGVGLVEAQSSSPLPGHDPDALAKILTAGLDDLAQQISTRLAQNQKRRIAVLEFVDLRANVTDLGRYCSERLITKLFQTDKFTVVERNLLNKIIAEQKLSLSAVIDPASAQKLGKVLGVDSIAIGSISDLNKTIELNARLLSTETGEVFSAASVEIIKDDTVCSLMGGCTANAAPPLQTDTKSVPQNRAVDANAIASKDIGSLRVVLKSIRRVSLNSGGYGFGGSGKGIRCSFEFINLETQKSVVVAMNAIAPVTGDSIGSYLRSTLVDENGGLWRLKNSDVAGMNKVGVGFIRGGGFSGGALYDPAEIGVVLSKRDDLNSDVIQNGLHFIYGSMSEMSPGQSITVTMTFMQDGGQTDAPPKVFQLATEIVVGSSTGTKKSYSLHNFTFDQVSLAGRN